MRLVLAADAVRRRTKEIAIRKLFGARHRDIVALVAKALQVLVAAPARHRLAAGGRGHRALSVGLCGTGPHRLVAAGLRAAAGMRHAWLAARLSPASALRA